MEQQYTFVLKFKLPRDQFSDDDIMGLLEEVERHFERKHRIQLDGDRRPGISDTCTKMSCPPSYRRGQAR